MERAGSEYECLSKIFSTHLPSPKFTRGRHGSAVICTTSEMLVPCEIKAKENVSFSLDLKSLAVKWRKIGKKKTLTLVRDGVVTM